jgi:hypothetical protein
MNRVFHHQCSASALSVTRAGLAVQHCSTQYRVTFTDTQLPNATMLCAALLLLDRWQAGAPAAAAVCLGLISVPQQGGAAHARDRQSLSSQHRSFCVRTQGGDVQRKGINELLQLLRVERTIQQAILQGRMLLQQWQVRQQQLRHLRGWTRRRQYDLLRNQCRRWIRWQQLVRRPGVPARCAGLHD